MCLVLCSYKHTPGYRLILAANRDEFLSRPTAPLGYLNREEKILAGCDMLGGGTWLGISVTGKLAALTNYRDPGRFLANAPSRGRVALDYLKSDKSAQQFLSDLGAGAKNYNGFNLLAADRAGLYFYSNIDCEMVQLKPGMYGFSNHLLDSGWPKVERGKNLFEKTLGREGEVDPAQLFALLEDRKQPPDDQLPDTGVGAGWERLLGSIFIHGSTYGTRSSSVIMVADDGQTLFVERTFGYPGAARETDRLEFRLQTDILAG